MKKFTLLAMSLMVLALAGLAFKGSPQLQRRRLVISETAGFTQIVKQLIADIPAIIPDIAPTPFFVRCCAGVVRPLRTPSSPFLYSSSQRSPPVVAL
jgi:hypothetical protein